MLQRLGLMLVLLLLMVNNVFSATITYTTDYGIKNILLLLFLVILFCFWLYVYKSSEKFEWDKKNLLSSVTNLVVKFVCWGWFISIIFIFQSVLFISSSASFLSDKLDLIYIVAISSAMLLSIVGLLNMLKIYNKVSGTTDFFREFVYEIKTGGKK